MKVAFFSNNFLFCPHSNKANTFQGRCLEVNVFFEKSYTQLTFFNIVNMTYIMQVGILKIKNTQIIHNKKSRNVKFAAWFLLPLLDLNQRPSD